MDERELESQHGGRAHSSNNARTTSRGRVAGNDRARELLPFTSSESNGSGVARLPSLTVHVSPPGSRSVSRQTSLESSASTVPHGHAVGSAIVDGGGARIGAPRARDVSFIGGDDLLTAPLHARVSDAHD